MLGQGPNNLSFYVVRDKKQNENLKYWRRQIFFAQSCVRKNSPNVDGDKKQCSFFCVAFGGFFCRAASE